MGIRGGQGGLLALLAVVGGLSGCPQSQPDAVAEAPMVKVAAIEPGERAQPDLFGTVVAAVETPVGFEIGGRIATRPVSRGATVVAGQVLATLDPAPLKASADSARAAQVQAAAQADFARQNVARVRALFEKKLASPQELDQAVSQAKAADAALAAAAANAERAQLNLAYATLKAPFDGVVTALSADQGAVVAAGQPVLTLAKAGTRSVLVAVPEARMSQLPERAAVALPPGFPPLPAPLTVNGFEAEGAAEAASRTVAVRFHLPADAPVALGQSVRLHFSDTPVLKTVPIGAIGGENHQALLWVVQQGTVRPYPVTVLALTDERAIIETNLPLGTPVVALGTNRLHPGEKVRIQPPMGIDVPAVPGSSTTPGAL
ncbi:efflux RND transporter periplasmic adaptor subunit [Halothiobacillus sp. DCM-1]|uniref:efflux RND transporter periplasmic adaptor subunit n=1 Tax=Halothiobacillus sp. DCM-1 TaxID=3112558 RepID=UPI00324FD0A3